MSRRTMLAGAVVGGAGVGFLDAVAGGAPAGATPPASLTRRITVLGSTDLHGHIENWDYYGRSPSPDDVRPRIAVTSS